MQLKASEKNQQSTGVAETTSIPLISLKSPDALHGIRRSTRKKRSIGHLDQSKNSPHLQSPTGDKDCDKRARHGYERQPRHKTHDDHYEYKESSAAGSRPEARKGRANNRRGRKHTLTDGFQEMTVTGNRLTIPNQASLGIFNKGKTSSAAGHLANRPWVDITKDVPRKWSKRNPAESDLAFSEMNFLSRRKNISPGPTLTAPEDTPCAQREKRNQSNASTYPLSKSVSKKHARRSCHGLGQQRDVSPTRLSSFVIAPIHKISLASRPSGCASPSEMFDESSSSSPYIWLESEAHDTLLEFTLQQCLLEALHSGLNSQGVYETTSDYLSDIRYWSIAELWIFLEERKATWPTGIDREQPRSSRPKSRDQDTVKQAVQPSPKYITPPKLGFVCADTNERFQACPTPSDALEPSSGMHNDSLLWENKSRPHQPKTRRGDASLRTARDYDRSGAFAEGCQSPPRAKAKHFSTFSQQYLPIITPVLGMEEMNHVSDDVLFYETLEAAYNAIIHPKATEQALVLDDLDLTILFGSSRFNETGDPFTTPESVRGMSGVITTQAGDTEHPPPLAQSIKQERADTRILRPSHQDEQLRNSSRDGELDQNTTLPWLTQYNKSQLHVPILRTLERNQDPDLSHFGRHNRLY
ncbi:hypothetical protein PENANT_c077G03646 [Penicillium antarcticum]|uniref:Uncharacterized protein n=1 Tax=Penicillium antarcticum TaxID=416450 RepID=A0A1V6PPI0_9EURO|nr:uncharacterized protein N7508_005242 [Penicillium antarcticum]KAJ5306227.1 hypothetical protein N7508_005242 [Penicillium antarcticum]OQD78831.1 hypothetical protein PENANT_c077G03646 [Penicillium antarcticum]